MTITTDEVPILTSADPTRADTQQAWDLPIRDDLAAIALAEPAEDDAPDRFARARAGRTAAPGAPAASAASGATAPPWPCAWRASTGD